MIKFFHSPKRQTLPATSRFPQIELRSSDENKSNGIIPFSHLYLTSASQLGHLARYAGKTCELASVPAETGEWMLNHSRCPVNISFKQQGLERLLTESGLATQSEIKICVLNGMGRGYGDNVAGLAAVQRLRTWLAGRFEQVQIDLMQRNTTTQSLIYQRHDAVDNVLQLPVTVTKFYSYDAYADITDLLSIAEFNQLSLYDFFIKSFSLQHVVADDSSKAAALSVDLDEKKRLRALAIKRSGRIFKKQKLVLLHPVASSPLRSMPEDVLQRIMPEVLKKSRKLFVTCVPLNIKHKNIIDMSDQSTDIHAFFDIIASCDAAISVGTVAYHVSGSFNIPTLLIPTVNADIESSKCLPSVSCHLPEEARQHISELHMSRVDEDINGVRPVWDSLEAEHIIRFLKKVL